MRSVKVTALNVGSYVFALVERKRVKRVLYGRGALKIMRIIGLRVLSRHTCCDVCRRRVYALNDVGVIKVDHGDVMMICRDCAISSVKLISDILISICDSMTSDDVC